MYRSGSKERGYVQKSPEVTTTINRGRKRVIDVDREDKEGDHECCYTDLGKMNPEAEDRLSAKDSARDSVFVQISIQSPPLNDICL